MKTYGETLFERSVQQGVEQGRREEAVFYTLNLLNSRIGEVSVRAQARIRHLSIEQLHQLGFATGEFNQASDLTAWLRTHKH